MSKHTPGPWIAQSHSRTHYVTTASPDEPELIADVYPGGTESASANTHLIAAAPDLLAACREAILYFLMVNRAEEVDDQVLALQKHEAMQLLIPALRKAGVR